MPKMKNTKLRIEALKGWLEMIKQGKGRPKPVKNNN